MSYDVLFEADSRDPETAEVAEPLNHTYNCGPMFRRALGGEGISGLDGKRCGDLVPLLRGAVRHIADADNAAEYVAMNPPNKWGSHESATQFLRAILATCEAHPAATIRVS